jgi:hypothetical protein
LFLFYTTFYLLHVTFYYDPFFFGLTKVLMDRFCCSIELHEKDSAKDPIVEEGDVYFKQMASVW